MPGAFIIVRDQSLSACIKGLSSSPDDLILNGIVRFAPYVQQIVTFGDLTRKRVTLDGSIDSICLIEHGAADVIGDMGGEVFERNFRVWLADPATKQIADFQSTITRVYMVPCGSGVPGSPVAASGSAIDAARLEADRLLAAFPEHRPRVGTSIDSRVRSLFPRAHVVGTHPYLNVINPIVKIPAVQISEPRPLFRTLWGLVAPSTSTYRDDAIGSLVRCLGSKEQFVPTDMLVLAKELPKAAAQHLSAYRDDLILGWCLGELYPEEGTTPMSAEQFKICLKVGFDVDIPVIRPTMFAFLKHILEIFIQKTVAIVPERQEVLGQLDKATDGVMLVRVLQDAADKSAHAVECRELSRLLSSAVYFTNERVLSDDPTAKKALRPFFEKLGSLALVPGISPIPRVAKLDGRSEYEKFLATSLQAIASTEGRRTLDQQRQLWEQLLDLLPSAQPRPGKG